MECLDQQDELGERFDYLRMARGTNLPAGTGIRLQ